MGALKNVWNSPHLNIWSKYLLFCDTHESTIVGMWSLVNEEISLKQTGSFLTSKHLTYTVTWGRNTKGTRKENILRHTSCLQHDRCPPIGLHWEKSSRTIWQASTTNVDHMLWHSLPNWTSLPSQQSLHCQKSPPPLCQRTWSYHRQIWLPQALDKGSITRAVLESIDHVPYRQTCYHSCPPWRMATTKN
jgi:hypothetical protein